MAPASSRLLPDHGSHRLDTLPLDIQIMIFQNFSDLSLTDPELLDLAQRDALCGLHKRSDLAALSRVNKAINITVEPFLYHTFIYVDIHRQKPLKLLTTLLRRPELGRHVRRILRGPCLMTSYWEDCDDRNDRSDDDDLDCAYDAIQALKTFSNCRRLHTPDGQIAARHGSHEHSELSLGAEACLYSTMLCPLAGGLVLTDWICAIMLLSPRTRFLFASGFIHLRDMTMSSSLMTNPVSSVANLTTLHLGKDFATPASLVGVTLLTSLKHLSIEQSCESWHCRRRDRRKEILPMPARGNCQLTSLSLSVRCPRVTAYLAPICFELQKLQLFIATAPYQVCPAQPVEPVLLGLVAPLSRLPRRLEGIEGLVLCEMTSIASIQPMFAAENLRSFTGLRYLELSRACWLALIESTTGNEGLDDFLPGRIDSLKLHISSQDLPYLAGLLRRSRPMPLRRLRLVLETWDSMIAESVARLGEGMRDLKIICLPPISDGESSTDDDTELE